MQKRWTWMILVLVALMALWGCSDDDDPAAPQKTAFETVAEAGAAYINGTGAYDYTIGSSLIGASELAATLEPGKASTVYTVVDIRSADVYNNSGHIPGAYLSTPATILNDIAAGTIPDDKPFVIACYSGQSAGHVVIGLNLLGYPAKSLKFGMASWHSSFAGTWTGKTANNLPEADTSTDASPALEDQAYPTLTETGDVLRQRVQAMLAAGFKGMAYTGTTSGVTYLDDNLDNSDFFIVNYFGPEDYLGTGTKGTPGHIRGACQFTPGASLGLGQMLNKLPSDPTAVIVVYCWTGQTSSQVTAYLNMLGYNAYSLTNGSNNLFYDDLTAGGWKWDPNAVVDLPLETAAQTLVAVD